MLNQSDLNLDRAEDAGTAQDLRGTVVFGSVAFGEIAAFSGDSVVVQPGYDDCLPGLRGCGWRDPAQPHDLETTT